MKVTFSRQELAACLLFASEDESRFVLNSLCFKYRPGEQPIAVATDAVRLTIIETKAEQLVSAEGSECQIVVASPFLRAVCALNKAVGGKLFPLVTFESKAGSNRLSVTMNGGKLYLEAEEGALIEGNYPDWRGVMPPKNQKRQPITEVGINSEFIGDYAKAIKLLEASSLAVQMSLVGKEQAIEVALPAAPNFYSLIMQCKLEESVDYQPEFTGIVKDLPKPEEKPEMEPETEKA